MPKTILIHPSDCRSPGEIIFKPIPLNQYQRSIQYEFGRFGRMDLIQIQRDMEILRCFEMMLNEVKLRGNYHGIEYTHRGPAHLSIGQESAAVGQAHFLGVEEGFAGGSVRDLATDFLIYGVLSEIFGRDYGFNRGLGGSMHAFFAPFGIMPNNAIVGASADLSVGAALFKKVNERPGIIICNIGDASLSCGPVWEALCFATMDQFKMLWTNNHRGGLPLIFNFMNNFYGMGGQPVGETMGIGVLARVGAGVNPAQMHAERVDGFNPLAVIDAIERKKKILHEGDGPVLLDTVTRSEEHTSELQ